jgi:hypothetical protein
MNPGSRKTQLHLTKLQFALPALEWIIAVIPEDGKGFVFRKPILSRKMFSRENVEWYRARNANGCHIYGRPNSTKYILLDLDSDGQAKLDQLKSDNFTPTAVIETSPDNFHVWIAVSGVDLPIPIATTLSKLICKRYGGDVGSTDALHVGRLPGLRNKKPQYRTCDADGGPLVLLRTARHAPIIPDGVGMLLREAISIVENGDTLPLPSTHGACALVSNTSRNIDIDPSRSTMTATEAREIYMHDIQFQAVRNNWNLPIQKGLRSDADFAVVKGLYLRETFELDDLAALLMYESEKATERTPSAKLEYVVATVESATGNKGK